MTRKVFVPSLALLMACWVNQEIQLPPNYHGWVVIHFDDPACTQDDIHRILVNNQGVACLRSAFKSGYRKTSFKTGAVPLKRTDPGGGGQIWGEAIRRSRGRIDYVFFVGAEGQFNVAGGAPL